MASGPQQLPPEGNSIRDEIARGSFAYVHGQHARKRAGIRPECPHGSQPQIAVLSQKQHHASYQGRAAEQRAMSFLIASKVSASETITEKRGLPECEAETFSSNGVHPAGGVADQCRPSAIHVAQFSGEGNPASFAGG